MAEPLNTLPKCSRDPDEGGGDWRRECWRRECWRGRARGGRRGKRNGVGPVYWTTCTVLAADPEREFAFAVNGPGGMTVNTWRYRLAPGPDGTGTDVTESFQLPRTPPNVLYWLVAGPFRLRTNLNGMRHPGADQGHRRTPRLTTRAPR